MPQARKPSVARHGTTSLYLHATKVSWARGVSAKLQDNSKSQVGLAALFHSGAALGPASAESDCSARSLVRTSQVWEFSKPHIRGELKFLRLWRPTQHPISC